jgi:hypothetical protein
VPSFFSAFSAVAAARAIARHGVVLSKYPAALL